MADGDFGDAATAGANGAGNAATAANGYKDGDAEGAGNAANYLHNADYRAELQAAAAPLSTRQITRFIHRIMETQTALDRNVNPRLAMEVLMLDIPN